ncbi:helix-turn-helix domain-containing protein [Lysobacter sp. 5GHs7-4]|uniref:helix-turn-helix domain-containing protein n=1 Tax=Lysobacter sp. 5GHs7-4 TaxID=2904253 RepID=UPI0017BA24E8|nr:helix-turn-helix domain-containing protein [Lysobacter sp. 5GHs7-4]NUO77855.1 helix-turn-helix domain-containing protein [Lysobacter sp.]UHQ24046.1 helix-turn-helix domain-containing protein [Lysobacter sp. 5GHs7-4]
MTPQQRIRLARRHAGMSQAALGAAVGVQRSAVGHWESAQGKFPSVAHLREVALITGVQFEWLATGRGKMNLSADTEMDSVAAAEALLVDDPLELRLIVAFRDTPTKSKAPLVEIAEQLAELRTGRPRATLTKGSRVVL